MAPSSLTPVGTEVRRFLLHESVSFVRCATSISGVRKIGLLGSLTTEKPEPKDIDLLVTIDDDVDLTALAAAGRRLKGKAQGRNKGADIFLANPIGIYIGRTCSWRKCQPGIRIACRADHCGDRTFLYDDLSDLTLPEHLVNNPPIQLWPEVIRNVKVPPDVEVHLIRQLQFPSAAGRDGA